MATATPWSLLSYRQQGMSLKDAQQAFQDSQKAVNEIKNVNESLMGFTDNIDSWMNTNQALNTFKKDVNAWPILWWQTVKPVVAPTVKPVVVSTIKPVSIVNTPVVDTGGLNWWPKSEVKKTNVGTYVSDFKDSLSGNDVNSIKKSISTAGGDINKYYTDIGYDTFSDKKKKLATDIFDRAQKNKDIYTKQAEDLTSNIWKQVTQVDTSATDLTKAVNDNKALQDTFFTDENAKEDTAFANFETEQNKLLSGYESNRLNQVQWDLRRALLSRWVDVTKIPPEQLIALSGSVWAQAFSDVSAAKERASNSIETARQNKIARVRQLKAQKLLSDTQTNSAIADINTKSAELKNNLDMKLAETVFGINVQKQTKTEADKATAASNILTVAKELGVSGTNFGVIQSTIANAKTTPEALNMMLTELQNKESPLYQVALSAQTAAQKAAIFANQLKQYEAETDRIKANKVWSSGTVINTYRPWDPQAGQP